jgi:lipoate-protein ligase A
LDVLDVEAYRSLLERSAVVARVERPTLVLGSTQPADLFDSGRAAAAGIAIVRRRSGGGAVLLHPDDHVWVNVWVPRSDPLWLEDVTAAAAWVGEWWCAALGGAGAEVHRSRAVPGPGDGVVCFAGRGPGELFVGGRKVMGLSQWRSREGSLFMACSYVMWDPALLVSLLARPDGSRAALLSEVSDVAVGIGPTAAGLLADRLLRSLPQHPLPTT